MFFLIYELLTVQDGLHFYTNIIKLAILNLVQKKKTMHLDQDLLQLTKSDKVKESSLQGFSWP